MNTPEEKITYSVICENSPTPDIYFDTYEEAVSMAKFSKTACKPYYIVERVECFEICGMVN